MDSDDEIFTYVPLKRKKVSGQPVSASQISFSQNNKKCKLPKNFIEGSQISSVNRSKLFLSPAVKRTNTKFLSKKLNNFSEKVGQQISKKQTSVEYPESVITISSSEAAPDSYCSRCQMPWKEYLQERKEKFKHSNACEFKNLKILEECLYGETCLETCEQHFWKFKHEVLSKQRSNLSSNNLQSESSGIKERSQLRTVMQSSMTGKESIPDLDIDKLTYKKNNFNINGMDHNKIIKCDFKGLEFSEKVESWLAMKCIPNVQAEVKPSCQDTNYEPASPSKTCVHFSFNLDSTSSPKKIQTTLDKFFKNCSPSSSSGYIKLNDEKLNSISKNITVSNVASTNVSAIQEWKSILPSKKAPSIKLNQSSSFLVKPNEYKPKKCPFYKKIEDTSFAVDAFNYGHIEGVTHYFLTHFHYDHYEGLNKKFDKNIYCSQITANLVKLKLGIKEQYLKVLTIEEPRIIDKAEVSCFDANHCPGAVMFLFRLSNGKTILHVGDFRFHHNMESISALWSADLEVLYLDTTYLNPCYDFPSQERILEKIKEIASEYNKSCKRVVFLVGSYTIGKEKVFKIIAETLDCKIYAPLWKMKILRCLQDEEIYKRLTVSKSEAKVHVVTMKEIHLQNLQKYVNSLGSSVVGVGICPTGWNHNLDIANDLNNLQAKQVGNIYKYDIPYSEHSSYNELERFVKFLRPKRIIPTVKVNSEYQRKEMDHILQTWVHQSKKSLVKAYVSHSQY